MSTKEKILNEFKMIKANSEECQNLLNNMYEDNIKLSLEDLHMLSKIMAMLTSMFYEYLKEHIKYVQDCKDIRIEAISIKYILCRASDTLDELIAKV